MTDSVCTSYEATNHITRGSHRISQSTVDEVLMEESSADSSPQQRPTEEKNAIDSDSKDCFIKAYGHVLDGSTPRPRGDGFTSALEGKRFCRYFYF